MAANPYKPPSSNVSDVDTDNYQDVRFFSPRGRIGRLRYFAYSMVGSTAIMFVFGILGAIVGQAALGAILVIAYIPLLLFGVLLLIQRSHDMNWNGWMSLLALIPFVSLIFLFMPGTKGENDYGAPPPPNTLGVKICAFAPIILIGVLAAVAIPAYQDYVERAQQQMEQSE